MNKPIRTISVFCLVLFLALMLNATYLMYLRSGSLTEDPQNRRVITAAFSRERGAILVGKDPVARTHIINILARFNQPEVAQALQRQLKDTNKFVRQAVLNALSGMGANADVGLLCEVLRPVDGLGALADHPALSAYVDRATDRPAFRKAHADQLAHFAAADAAASAA